MATHNFIEKLITTIIELGYELNREWQLEPLYYKGFKVKGYSKRKVQYGLNNLRYRGILKHSPRGCYKFTDKGRHWFGKSLLRYHRLAKTKWDRRWRILIFDIPEEFHKERNRLRLRLKTWGFYMLQKSVFVFPYPFEKELSAYCQDLKINDYINIIIAESLGYVDKEVRSFYDL